MCGVPTGKRGSAVREAVYNYRDEGGDPLFRVVREAPKDFYQERRLPGGGWTRKVKGVRLVLYRLPELLNARDDRPDDWVFIVEGEKDVESLVALGAVATCNPGGANAIWRDEFSHVLAGRRCCIIADKDAPGRKHADQVAESLQGVASVVCKIELPGDGVKDATDWIRAGGTLPQLLEIAESAKPASDFSPRIGIPHPSKPTEPNEPTNPIEPTNSAAGAERIPINSACPPMSVERAIDATLPAEAGQRRMCLMHFARALKFNCGLANEPVRTMKPHVEAWWERAERIVATKDFDDSWDRFVECWRDARIGLYEKPIRAAIVRADADPASPRHGPRDSTNRKRLIRIIEELAGPTGIFVLSGYQAAEALGIKQQSAYNALRTLEAEEIIANIDRGTKGRGGRPGKWRLLPLAHAVPVQAEPVAREAA